MDDRQANALLAGTLALMTQFAESRCPFGAQKICENLLLLSALHQMPWEFRTVIAKLGARWEQLLGESRGAVTPPVRH